jgi:hypothetical protein
VQQLIPVAFIRFGACRFPPSYFVSELTDPKNKRDAKAEVRTPDSLSFIVIADGQRQTLTLAFSHSPSHLLLPKKHPLQQLYKLSSALIKKRWHFHDPSTSQMYGGMESLVPNPVFRLNLVMV